MTDRDLQPTRDAGYTPAALRGLPLAEQTLPALLERQAAAYGDKALFRCDGHTWSFRQTRDVAEASARRLAAGGVEPGDRLALMCRNRIELLELILGCSWLGSVAVPLNTALRGDQLVHQLTNSGARVLALDSELVGTIAQTAPVATLERLWALDGIPDGVPARYEVTERPEGEAEIPAVRGEAGDTAAILYTSGTTGPAKGVCCPQAQFYWWGVLVTEMLGLTEDDTLYTNLPMFHTNALNSFSQALVAGATLELGPHFSASRFWDRIRDSGATVTYLLGAMVNILVSLPETEQDRDHAVRIALAPGTPEEVFYRFRERFGIPLVEGYGSTETNCPIGVPPDEQRAGWMGKAREGFHVRVVDGNDDEVPPGCGGELVFRHDPPYAFSTGYFEMPEKTVEAWRNLWFHTGDRVERNEEGWIRFLDRLKDSIRRRGENISSYEVEQAVLSHPAVEAVSAFAAASELSEDEVAIAVIPVGGKTPDPVDLIRHCESRLAYFAIPRYVRFVEALPLTENGKVKKAVLREEGVGDAFDREGAGIELSR